MIVLQILALAAAFTIALFYFGYGIVRVLLPYHFRAWRVLLTPFAGMALVIVWDYLALFFGMDLTRATWILLAIVTLLNGFVFARVWRTQRAAIFQNAFSREHAPVVAIALVAFIAAVAPLMRYGYATIIGENWDYEFYLPLADYLRIMPTAALVNAPPNPLLTTILSRHILPLPMGFSYLQATLDVLTQSQALDSFAILMGVLRAFGVIAAFVFFRATFKMSARTAFGAAGLLALNGLLLWFTYWSFALHLASLALLPLALAFGAFAMTQRDATRIETARALFVAGFFLGALNVTYHPALVAVALPLVAIGVYKLITEKQRVEIFLRGILVIALVVAFSFPTLFHISDFIREYYGRAPLAIGLREFVPLSDGYGLSLYILDLAVGHTIPTPWLYEIVSRAWNVGAPVLTIAAVLFSLYALWQLRADRERRAVWYLIVGASVFYIALFRLPFLRPYPYGFLKSVSLVSYVLLALAVQGIEFGIRKADFRMQRVVPPVTTILFAAIALFTLFTFGLSVEQYFKPQPAFFNADDLKLRAVAAQVPSNAEIFLSDRDEVQKIPMGLAAYALLQNPLRGNVTTGYGKLDNVQNGRVYDYALLARGQDPNTRGYQNNALWENETFALYARSPGALIQQTLNHRQDTTLPYELTVDENGVPQKQKDVSQTPVDRALTLALLTFTPRTILLQAGEQSATVNLKAGVHVYSFSRVHLPATVKVKPETAGALWVTSLQLREPDSASAGLVTSDAMGISCWGGDKDLSARCTVVNPARRALTWKWIVRGTLAGTRDERVISQGEATGAPQDTVRIDAGTFGDLQAIRFDNAIAARFTNKNLPPGKWRADVEIWNGKSLLARFAVHSLIEIQGNNIKVQANGNLPPAILQP